MKKIIWIDDDVDKRTSYAEAIRKALSVELNCFSDAQEGLSALLTNVYDAALVDLRMPEIDGFQIIDECIDREIEADLCVLSSYLYLSEYKERLLGYERRIELLDKEFPSIQSPDFESLFMEPLRDFIHGGARRTVKTQFRKILPRGMDPFSVTYEQYRSMSLREKDQLTERAKALAKEVIKDSFSEGFTWVFLCGSATNIKEKAYAAKDRLAHDEMIEFAKKRDRAPFQFFAPSKVEDIKVDEPEEWVDCGKEDWLSNYPTLDLEFGETRLKVHFDTGAHETFMSAEELIAAGVINSNDMMWSPTELQGEEIQATNLQLEVMYRCPVSDITKMFVLNGQIVRDWNTNPLMRRCPGQSCVQLSPVSIEGGYCKLRVGLIGRNVLTDNHISLVLDGALKVVRLEGSTVKKKRA